MMNSAPILTGFSFKKVNSSALVANKFEKGSDGIDTVNPLSPSKSLSGEVVSLESCPGKHRLHATSLDAGDKQMLLTSDASFKTEFHIDSGPLTSPSPTKKSQPLYDATSPDAMSSFVDKKANKVDNEKFKPIAEPVPQELITADNSVNRSISPSTMPRKEDVVKNGASFLMAMNLTKKRLAEYTKKFGKEVHEMVDQSSERAGSIFSAVGKANLLIEKKFKQFEELCNWNLQEELGDQPVTTNEDLGGFWDMVMIQVDQVYALFQKLEGVEPENSKIIPDKSKSKVRGSSSRKISRPKSTSKSHNSEAAKARDASRRKMLAEKRRMMKTQSQSVETGTSIDQKPVVIFTPDTPENHAKALLMISDTQYPVPSSNISDPTGIFQNFV